MALHFIGLIGLANQFPMNMIACFVGAGIEAVILVSLYGRIGQTVDPKGPYGLTDAEIRVRRMKQEHPK